ncbi:MAG: NAD-dependent epimerase/dehydratase family protein, partial [Actinomycetota bacterium]
EEIKDDARIWPVDLRDQQSVERVVQEVRPEWIFHLAAYGAYPAQTEPGLMVQTNIVGTMNIVQACMHQLQREDGSFEVVFRGSSGRYAHGKGQAWSELTPDRSCEPLGGRSSQSFGTGQRSTSDAQLWLGGVR